MKLPNIDHFAAALLRMIQQGATSLDDCARTAAANHGVPVRAAYAQLVSRLSILVQRGLISYASGVGLEITAEGISELVAFRDFVNPYLP